MRSRGALTIKWSLCVFNTQSMSRYMYSNVPQNLDWDTKSPVKFNTGTNTETRRIPLLVIVVVVLGDRFCRFGGEQGDVGGSMLHWLLLVLAGCVGAHGACAAWIGLAPVGLRRKSYLHATTGLVDASPPPLGLGSEKGKKLQVNYNDVFCVHSDLFSVRNKSWCTELRWHPTRRSSPAISLWLPRLVSWVGIEAYKRF